MSFGTKSFPEGMISVMKRHLEESIKPNGLSWSDLYDLYLKELQTEGKFSEAEEDYRLAMEIAQWAKGGQPEMEYSEAEEDYQTALRIAQHVNPKKIEEE